MTKAALVGLTKCLAVEYADRNIRVNCSQLGYARTPMVEKMALESNPEDPESAIADIAAGVPMKRLANPIEVGELFAFLGSDESSYLTGSQIVIDGGSTLPETMSIRRQHPARDHVHRHQLAPHRRAAESGLQRHRNRLGRPTAERWVGRLAMRQDPMRNHELSIGNI